MRRFTVIFLSLMTLLVASCNKKQLETTYDKQETNIQKIIESLKKANPEATVEYIKGSAVVTTVHGEGESLAENGAVSFYYAGYVVSGASLANGNVFATNYETFAKSIRWNVTDSTVFNISTVKLGEDDLVEGLKNGLVGVKGGDECYVLFSGKHGFGNKKIGNIPASSALAYHLWIKSVSNN